MAPPRDHPFSKGSHTVEDELEDLPTSRSALLLLGVFILASVSYFTHGYVNGFASSMSPLPKDSMHMAKPNHNLTVDLRYASYRGMVRNATPDVISWLGVPYAHPPRRFRAPQILDETPRKHKVEDKQVHPEPCAQNGVGGVRGMIGTEDCLFLNIHSPKAYDNLDSYPVLVYIHGGGYQSGDPGDWSFNHWIQRAPTPFVAVGIYYRLSAFGFLASPDPPEKGVHEGLGKGSPDEIKKLVNQQETDPELLLNAGLHDQRLALQWIQRHISAFGGDPKRVSIMGHGAGAASVGLHLVAATQVSEQPLFRRVILQSWYRPTVPHTSDLKAAWNHLAKSVGCSHWFGSTQNVLECLRQADASKLLQAADEASLKHANHAHWIWRPVVDMDLFSDHPHKLMKEKKDVDIMVGHTTHDSITAGPTSASFVFALRTIYPKLSSPDARKLERLYVQYGIPRDSVSEFGIGEGIFRCGMHVLGKIYGSRMYSYRFDEPNSFDSERADHYADVEILLEGIQTTSGDSNESDPLTHARRVLSDEMISYIVSFVATGDPNAYSSLKLTKHTSPTWPRYSWNKRLVFRANAGGTGETNGFSGASHLESLDASEMERCNIWETMNAGLQF